MKRSNVGAESRHDMSRQAYPSNRAMSGLSDGKRTLYDKRAPTCREWNPVLHKRRGPVLHYVCLPLKDFVERASCANGGRL